MEPQIKKTIEVFRNYDEKVSSNEDRDLLRRQVEALEGIGKCLSTYGSMRYKIKSFEKLISDPWMEDQSAFDAVYTAWKEFSTSYQREIGGMTVNERLCHMGLMEDFEANICNPSKMRAVLRAAFLSAEDVAAIVKAQRKNRAGG